MAGVLGFEPRDAGTKNRCLTAWLYPNVLIKISELTEKSRYLAKIVCSCMFYFKKYSLKMIWQKLSQAAQESN